MSLLLELDVKKGLRNFRWIGLKQLPGLEIRGKRREKEGTREERELGRKSQRHGEQKVFGGDEPMSCTGG